MRTLEEFVATRVYTDTKSFAEVVGCYPEDFDTTHVLVYVNTLYIHYHGAKDFSLTLLNQTYTGSLGELEKELYKFYLEEYAS